MPISEVSNLWSKPEEISNDGPPSIHIANYPTSKNMISIAKTKDLPTESLIFSLDPDCKSKNKGILAIIRNLFPKVTSQLNKKNLIKREIKATN